MAPFKATTIQLAKETVWGTTVSPAIAKVMGIINVTCEQVDTIVQPPEMGRLAPSVLVAETNQMYQGEIEIQGSFEDLLYLVEGVLGTVAPTGVGPYLRTYTAPVATAATPIMYTAEFGNTGECYKLGGVLFDKLTFSWKQGELWHVKVSYLAKSFVTTTITALADHAVTLMTGCIFYLDAFAATLFTTPIAATIISFSLMIDLKRHLKFFGTIAAENFGDDTWDATLTTELEFNSTVKTLVDASVAGTLVQRLVAFKPVNNGAGAASTLAFAGTYKNVLRWGNRNGNKTVTLAWLCTPDATSLPTGVKILSTTGAATMLY
jgi:hypothetical protein